MKSIAASAAHAYVGPEHGLICGFVFNGESPAESLSLDAPPTQLPPVDRVMWLHFNGSNTTAQRWLAQLPSLPESVREVIDARETRVRVESIDEVFFAVLHDFAYQDAIDLSEIATLWICASARLIVTVRNRKTRSADVLRLAARGGFRARNGFEVLNRLLEIQNDTLKGWVVEIGKQVDYVEDQVVGERISGQREQLARIRRQCLYARRHFTPQRMALHRFLMCPSGGDSDTDVAGLRSLSDDFGFAIDESNSLQERAKLLQEELSALAAERTGHNLYVLTITTIILLPMTLVTGIFGMNIAGVPGVGETAASSAFWGVMLLMLIVGALTLWFLKWRKLI